VTTWAILLVLGAVAFLILEIAIPSFGLFGILSATSYTFALIIGFRESKELGIQLVAAGVVAAPFAVMFGFKLLHKTKLGRRTLLEPPTREEIGRLGAEDARALIGRVGRALTDLRPTGRADFDGTRVDVGAVSGYVSKDAAIRVVRVDGQLVVVEAAEEPPKESAS
jgi:membrane-bound serine protease (ClpP class)